MSSARAGPAREKGVRRRTGPPQLLPRICEVPKEVGATRKTRTEPTVFLFDSTLWVRISFYASAYSCTLSALPISDTTWRENRRMSMAAFSVGVIGASQMVSLIAILKPKGVIDSHCYAGDVHTRATSGGRHAKASGREAAKSQKSGNMIEDQRGFYAACCTGRAVVRPSRVRVRRRARRARSRPG